MLLPHRKPARLHRLRTCRLLNNQNSRPAKWETSWTPWGYTLDTWVKPKSKLKVFVLWRGQSAPTFSFEGIPSDPSKTPTTRQSMYVGAVPGVAQVDLTREECAALMKHLGLESDGEGAWKK